MAAGTTASRATGLIRTLVLAWALGVSPLADAYNAANTAPNMLFQLAAGGVLTSAVVPLLVRREGAERREAVSVLLGTVAAAGVLGAVLLAMLAPAVVRVLLAGAPGGAAGEGVRAAAVTWLRMFAPQVALYAVSVLAVGVMSARRRLGLGAWAPVLTNLIIIASATLFVADAGRRPSALHVSSSAVAWLGWGTTLAVGAMAAVQLWGALRTEHSPRPRLALRHPVVREMAAMGKWVLVYVAANQVGLAVVVALASTVGGGVSAYQWAFTVMQLPYAIVAVSVLSAAYPRLAAAAADGDDVSAVVRPTVTSAAPLLAAAVAGLGVMSGPIAAALVGPSDSALVDAAIRGFAVSLLPFSLFQLLTRTSYAHQDGRTPALVNLWVNAANIAVDVAVVVTTSDPETRVAGLAIGHAASYVVGCGLLGRRLRSQGRLLLGAAAHPAVRQVAWSLPVVALAAGATRVAVGEQTTQIGSAVLVGVAALAAAAALGASLALQRRIPLS